jgi:membrane peptidoglycan carboxypeptidase
MKSSPRRVVRSSKTRNTARTINNAHSPKKWFNHLLLLLDPRHFKENWLSKAGGIRVAKLAGVGFVILLAIFLWFGKDLPNPNKINAKLGGQTTKFWDRTHTKVLYEVYGDKNRSLIAFDQMPTTVKQATIAVEDKDFYKHGAFSVFGIGRAFTGVLTRTNRGGGSTITQQYVKNALLTDQRSLSRKIKELILAIEIEQRYSKDEILKLYLNEIPYGSQAYGIQTAAKTYFNKDAKDLTLDESATLAAMPQAPSYYSPYGPNTDALIARRNVVLTRMEEQGYITEQQMKAAKNTNTLAKVQPRQSRFAGVTAPHFVLYAQDILAEKYGELKVTEGGLDVTTTLDLDKQKAAEDAITDNIATVRKLGGSNAALTAGDPKTGQILAMVGSYDFSDENFGAVNVATSKRQPGSSFKPFAYATLFSKNYGPGTTVYDVKTDFGNYVPKNYTNKFYGVQSFRSALAGSLNIPAVKAFYMAGADDTIDTARKMGLTTLPKDDTYTIETVLGSHEVKQVDMVNAFESFANGGVHYESTPILKVTDPNAKVLEDNTKPKTPKRVLDPQVAYLMNNVMSDNNARAYIFGQNNPLVVPGQTVAAKTGTTTDYRDAWTMGYSTNLVAGVWAGNNDNTAMTQSASSVSAPVWNSFMKKALAGTKTEAFVRPAGIKEVTLDATTGRLATSTTTNKRTDIFPSWYKPATADNSGSTRIDKVSGKEATECTPELAIESNGSGSVLPEIPATDSQYTRWNTGVIAGLGFSYGSKAGGAGGKDDKHSCSDVKPTAALEVSGSAGNYVFKATATSGTFPAARIQIKLDGQIIGSKEVSGNGSYSLPYNVSDPGSHKVQATVIDTGFYSADSQVETVSGGTASTVNVGRSGNNITFTWSNDGSAIFTLKIDGIARYTGGYASPKTYNAGGGGHTWSFSSSNGGSDNGSI